MFLIATGQLQVTKYSAVLKTLVYYC